MDGQNIEDILDTNALNRLYNKGRLDILYGLSTKDIAKIISSPIINVYSAEESLDKEYLQHVITGLVSLRNPEKIVDLDAELLDLRNVLTDNKSKLEKTNSEILAAKKVKEGYENSLNRLERTAPFSNDDELIAGVDCGKEFRNEYQNLLNILETNKAIDENILNQTQVKLMNLADDLMDFEDLLGKTPGFDKYMAWGNACQKILNISDTNFKLKAKIELQKDEIKNKIADAYKNAEEETFFNMGFWSKGFPKVKDFVDKYDFIIGSKNRLKLRGAMYIAVNKETKTIPKLKIVPPPQLVYGPDKLVEIPSMTPYSAAAKEQQDK